MIYLVTKNQELFQNSDYKIISTPEALDLMKDWSVVQFDTETSGRDPHICHLLCAQFGNKAADTQIVVDCSTEKIEDYKEILESKLLIGHNLKFDCQFLYKHKIVPTQVWDTMIVEQLLYLGYPYLKLTPYEYQKHNCDYPYLVEEKTDSKTQSTTITYNLSYSLKAVAHKRLNVEMDKTVRGEIIWRGLDTAVIKYAAGDVVMLEDIKEQQEKDCNAKQCLVAASVENNFVPVIAYLEWCGIKLDAIGWKKKMDFEQSERDKYRRTLDKFIFDHPKDFGKYIYQDIQLDLFNPGLPEKQCTINWDSSQQVIQVFKQLGFNVLTEDKKTGEDKESAVERLLKGQIGINDYFLEIYFKYKEYAKVCSTYGQTYLDAINPLTGRIHTTFWQLGAASGRMSCGSKNPNTDLAKLKGLKESDCIYPQLQNLPADEKTRSLFIPEPGNLFTSADYSALELAYYYLYSKFFLIVYILNNILLFTDYSA